MRGSERGHRKDHHMSHVQSYKETLTYAAHVQKNYIIFVMNFLPDVLVMCTYA